MRDGTPSLTAQRVAAFRLLRDRLPASGTPSADTALARDVASGSTTPGDDRIRRHLRARTAFFDRVVVRALERGVSQILLVGAGYDGRALRYGRPETLWWEVDHPGTQADKRARLARLGIAAPHVTFVPFELEEPGLAPSLLATGFDPDGLSLICCEGVAPYLSRNALEHLLGDCRALVSPGGRLAVSVPLARTEEARAARTALARALQELGEPLSPPLDPDELEALLARTRWRQVAISEAAQRAGFLVLAPVWAPVAPGLPPSAGTLARFADTILSRPDRDAVTRHLARTYGVSVRHRSELDLGVHAVDLAGRRRWIARVHPIGREPAVHREVSLLGALHEAGFPCELPAADDPVSTLDGHPVLVTERVPGKPAASTPATFGLLGGFLGRLHATAPTTIPALPAGGAWHHLVLEGRPSTELAALRTLLSSAARRVRPGDVPSYDALTAAVDNGDGGDGLPHAVVHPDPVPRNVIRGPGGAVTVVDWSGAGLGPRLVSLGCLLWAASSDPASVRGAATAYRSSVVLTGLELDRLEGAMALRPLILAGWTFVTGRERLASVAAWWEAERRRVHAVVPLARSTLAGPSPQRHVVERS